MYKKKIIRIYKKESNSCCNRHYCSLHTCTHTSARGQSFMYLFQNTLHVSHLSAQPRPVLRGGRHPALTRGTTTKPGLTALCWEDYIRASSQAKIPPIHHNDLLQWHSLAVYLAVYTDVSDVDRAVDYCYTWQMAVIRWSWNGTAQGREEELRGGKRFPKKEKKNIQKRRRQSTCNKVQVMVHLTIQAGLRGIQEMVVNYVARTDRWR